MRWLGLALLAAVACGSDGGTTAGEALRDTARNLDDIRSARLDLRMTAESAGTKAPVGFAMSGPFALPEKQGLPVADMKVTELRGTQETTVSFVSTGTEAYVVRDGKATKLAGSGVSVGGKDGGLGSLRIDGWLRDPAMTDDGDVHRITAGLDVATAFDDLGRLGERLGAPLLAGLRPLDDAGRKALTNAAKDSTIEVWTGREDRLLRKLVLTVTLTAAGEVPEGLRDLVPVTLRLSLDLADVNRPVKVAPPPT